MIHNIQTNTKEYEDIIHGKQRFIIKRNDKNYKEDDTVHLNEMDDKNQINRTALAIITTVIDQDESLKPGYMVMSLKLVSYTRKIDLQKK